MEKYINKFTTYDIAKGLKDLGYNGLCIAYFETPLILNFYDFKYGCKIYTELDEFSINAPLWQDAIDWLELNFDVSISYQIGYLIHANKEFNREVDILSIRKRLVDQAIIVINRKLEQINNPES